MAEPVPELALAAICDELARAPAAFALVGDLPVSVRAKVRFTRDVDLIVIVSDDSEGESLIYEPRSAGDSAVASVEHDTRRRLSAVRLVSQSCLAAPALLDRIIAKQAAHREGDGMKRLGVRSFVTLGPEHSDESVVAPAHHGQRAVSRIEQPVVGNRSAMVETQLLDRVVLGVLWRNDFADPVGLGLHRHHGLARPDDEHPLTNVGCPIEASWF